MKEIFQSFFEKSNKSPSKLIQIPVSVDHRNIFDFQQFPINSSFDFQQLSFNFEETVLFCHDTKAKILFEN